jgi:hypothetical protein
MIKLSIAGIALALFAGATAAQQQPVKPKPAPQPAAKPAQTPVAQHAMFGTIKTLDLKANTLVVTPMQGADVTFKVDHRTTHIRGMAAATLPSLAKRTGSGIVVHYTGEATEMKAVGIDFIGTEPVKVADGTLVRVNKATRSIVIKTATGPEETFALAIGVPIEMATGLANLDTFATKLNERVSVYYTEKAGAKHVRLISMPATSAS